MKSFITVLQFFTRIPIKKDMAATSEDFAKGIVYFPIIGLIIGAFNLLVYLGAAKLISGLFPVVCAILANTVITGALHIDGLADTCDGLFSSRNKERMLEIMKDSRIGTNGAVAVLLDFLLKISVLYALDTKKILLALLLSPIAAKTIVVLLIFLSDYARKEGGMGGLFLVKQPFIRAVTGILIGTGVVFFFAKGAGLLLLAICLAASIAYRHFVYSKIQGMTGDTLGAANEVVEVVFLIAFAAFGRVGLA